MKSFNNVSIEIFSVNFGLFVRAIYCTLIQFFCTTMTKNIAVRQRLLLKNLNYYYVGINVEFLKRGLPKFELNLTEVFNEFIQQEVFANCPKFSQVIALHKRAIEQFQAYKSFPILIGTMKVFENLVLKRENKLCISFSLSTASQFGFQQKLSCVHVVVQIADFTRNKIEKRSIYPGCLLDQQKCSNPWFRQDSYKIFRSHF